MDRSYDSNVFYDDVEGSEAFAYYVSDEIFGNRDYDDVKYPEDLQVGDVICVDGDYGIVDKVYDDYCRYYTVYKDGEIYTTTVDFDDKDLDEMYTRY